LQRVTTLIRLWSRLNRWVTTTRASRRLRQGGRPLWAARYPRPGEHGFIGQSAVVRTGLVANAPAPVMLN
jgi:hypothetical protein